MAPTSFAPIPSVPSPVSPRPRGLPVGVPALLAAVLAVGAGGCGDDGGNGLGSTLPGFRQWPTPRVWSQGDRLGFATVYFEVRSPDDLATDPGDRRCFFWIDVVEATQSGGLPDTAREGPCLLTNQRRQAGVDRLPEDQLQPVCADEVDLSTSEVRVGNFDLCNPTGTLAREIEVPCGDLEVIPDSFRVVSDQGMDPADAVTMLDASTPRPAAPTIETPSLAGEGFALWPEGSLVVAWGGSVTPGADAKVELVVRRRDGTGPVLRCLADDTGQLEVPDALLPELRGREVVVELGRFNLVETVSDEIPFRLTYQVREAFFIEATR